VAKPTKNPVATGLLQPILSYSNCYRMEDGQRKLLLSQFNQQASTAVDHWIDR